MIKYISLACILSILFSCVSQDKYYTVNAEKIALQKEKDSPIISVEPFINDTRIFQVLEISQFG